MMSISDKNYKDIIYHEENGIGTITLNRPNKLNALHYPLLMDIVDVLEGIKKNQSIRVVVLKGAGRSFCSGDDLVSMMGAATDYPPLLEEGFKLPHHKVIYLIREIQKPVIALLQGYCLGAGFELALACDFRIAADNLEIGDHRTTRAIAILSGASWFLPRIIGLARATDILFTGKHLDAKEALDIGLINEYYPLLEFEEKSNEYVKRMAQMPTRCLGYNKAMINYSLTNDLFTSLQNDIFLFTENMKTADAREGHRSFLEKREPVFKGR
ncbi:MAG: enoyl-CoA hydratase/isomerase family protein [Promethearchaeota archaeon]|jgi:2-(1,2-epoxy-1,2-dihydrophenyl)acetyl-CoA isomerase